MMKANELRLGNFVRYRDEYDCVVCSLGHSFGTDQRHLDINKVGLLTGSDDIEEYEPIPLTEEWLMKLGFILDILHEGDSPIYYLNNNDNIFHIDSDTLQPLDAGFPICKYEIKFVHQIQNLYFVLTGEELKTKI